MAAITPLQRGILAFVAESIRERGYPPTLREIGARFAIAAPSSAAYHLKVLAERGLLERAGSLSRGLRPREDPLGLPVLGGVGAGAGVIAREDASERIPLDPALSRGADFLLKVRGDSMEGAGILEGDLVWVRRQDSAEEGDLVAALVGEEGVVKRLKRGGRAWALESANAKYPPLRGEFKIVGKVVGLMRRYER
jgi:repressor LexA